MRTGLILALAIMLGLATQAWADPDIGGRRVALVIGNGGYRNVDRLANATNDARLIATTLRGLNFTLVGGGPLLDLDRAHMAQAVEEFGRALVGAEVGLFYYSGHGLQVQGVNWLVPVDANPTRPQDLDFQMVDADLVLRQMDGAGTKLNLVLLDACRNNPFANRGLRAMQGGLAEMRAPQGTLISYSTQPGNVAVDGTGANSPYTEALADNMRQPGVDIFRMFNQVGLQVKRSTGGSQQPWVSNSPIDGDFYFAGAAAPPVQVAGLARAPEPALPAVPPVPVDPDERLRAIAKGRRCSILDARAVGNRIDVRGLALAGPDWSAFLDQFGTTRSIRVVAPEIEFLQPFACAPVDVLGASVLSTRETLGRLMTLPRREAAAGGVLTVTLLAAANPVVALDLFGADGMVEHLKIPAMATKRGDVQVSVAQRVGAAPGQHLLAALVSPMPLDLGARPPLERTDIYLAALRQALQTNPGARADMATYELRSPPPAVQNVVKVPAQAPRCAAIQERAQLGETMSEQDRAYLRANCR